MNKNQLKEAQRLVKRVNKETSSLSPYVVTTFMFDSGGFEIYIKARSTFNGVDTRKLMLGLFSLGLYVQMTCENGSPRLIVG